MRILQATDLSTWSGRIIDVREPDEFARERLDDARCESVPLGTLASRAAQWDREAPVLCLCQSGSRSAQAAGQLESMGFTSVATLEGGLRACRRAGIRLVSSRTPLPMQRQIMIGASAFLLTGLILAALVHPAFVALTWFVSIMLGLAGLTGICPMARMLAKMPWNTAAAGTSSCSVPQHQEVTA